MPKPPVSDPSPHEDLPSDIAFRLFLEGLTGDDVAHERDPRPGTAESRWVTAAYNRKRGTFDVRYGRH